MYAIIDIETTGGQYNEEGITEIAIYRFNGHEVIDTFASLINPERKIQPFVAKLTGINDKTVRNAPKFCQVAKRIVEITDGCTLVAHNAAFDNRVLTTEFDRLGYLFEKNTLCTVALSKKLVPGLPSYSLGKLARSLGIPLSDRHRAQGDATATVALFKLLLSKDVSKEIVKKHIRKGPKRAMGPKLLDMIAGTPSVCGVYYVHNAKGEIIYMGKSKNIKKRLTQHFTDDTQKAKRIQLEVSQVTYEKTGNELIAQLKEHEEIKQNRPRYNRALRNAQYKYQLVSARDARGYLNLKLEPADKNTVPITRFTRYRRAKNALQNIIDEYTLCPHLTGGNGAAGPCYNHTIKLCKGACTGKEGAKTYNQRVQRFMDRHGYASKNMMILGKGRDVEERSVVLIEGGAYQGYGYYNLNYQINDPTVLKRMITPMRNDRDTQQIITSYLRKNPGCKIVNLEPDPVN
ncbi:MAG: exonuclease domain-containing protein [Marinirhabdus sp.]